MIIDCHQHSVWHGRTGQDLVAYMDQTGVDKSWLLTWESIDGGLEPGYQHISIGQTFETAQAHPGRFVIGVAPDARRPDVIDLIRRCHARGARVLGEVKLRLMMDSPELIAAFRIAGELGMPVLFHLELPRIGTDGVSQWYLGDIDAVDRAISKCPQTTFIGHGPGWWAHFSNDDLGCREYYPRGPIIPGGKTIRLLEKHANLYADLSAGSGLHALNRDPQFGRQFMVDFADRVLYGTDYWDTRLLEHIRSLGLPADVLGKILSGNALKLAP